MLRSNQQPLNLKPDPGLEHTKMLSNLDLIKKGVNLLQLFKLWIQLQTLAGMVCIRQGLN